MHGHLNVRVVLYLLTFLTLALGAGETSSLCVGFFDLCERTSSTYWIGGWVSPSLCVCVCVCGVCVCVCVCGRFREERRLLPLLVEVLLTDTECIIISWPATLNSIAIVPSNSYTHAVNRERRIWVKIMSVVSRPYGERPRSCAANVSVAEGNTGNWGLVQGLHLCRW